MGALTSGIGAILRVAAAELKAKKDTIVQKADDVFDQLEVAGTKIVTDAESHIPIVGGYLVHATYQASQAAEAAIDAGTGNGFDQLIKLLEKEAAALGA